MSLYQTGDQSEDMARPEDTVRRRPRRGLHAAASESARQQDLPRVPQRDPAAVAAAAVLARDHELARMRARQINGVTAATRLAEELVFAHRQAGKPALGVLSDKVGYSKATLSKVFNNRMAPTWALVRKLGVHLRVPQVHIMQEWLPLWIAADMYRQAAKTGSVTGRATVPIQTAPAGSDMSNGTGPAAQAALTGPTGYSCPKCGSWVVDTALHTDWHMEHDPAGTNAPAAESTGAVRADTAEMTLLREALRPDDDA